MARNIGLIKYIVVSYFFIVYNNFRESILVRGRR